MKNGHRLLVKYSYVITDKSGKVIRKKTFQAQSYVTAMADMLHVNMCQSGATITDTGNTARTYAIGDTAAFNTQAGAGSVLFGIVVGTGTTAVALTDYKVGTLIEHDAAPPTAGRLQYGAMGFTFLATSGTTRKFTLTRTFTNQSGGTITIREIGLYVRYTAQSWYFCLDRTLTGAVAVTNGQAIAWTCTIGVTV